MRVAIPYWQGRISPVFDVAGNLLLVDVANGREQARCSVVLDTEQPQARADLLVEQGANILICGAISWPLERLLAVANIEVIPQTCGDVEQVLAAFINGQLQQDAFLMPGCCGQRRRFRMRGRHGGRHLKSKRDPIMPRGDGTGPSKGGQRGQGRMGGPSAAGPGGVCVCPKCGYKASHVAGQPCNQQTCPKCGITMTRG